MRVESASGIECRKYGKAHPKTRTWCAELNADEIAQFEEWMMTSPHAPTMLQAAKTHKML